MKIIFHKFHGAGNDFIIIYSTDSLKIRLNRAQIQQLCSRKRGIGADGLIIIKTSNKTLSRFTYYNSDGSEAEFCGNGLRCAALAEYLRTGSKKICLNSSCGIFHCTIRAKNLVEIEVPITKFPEKISVPNYKNAYFCITGVPHLVIPVKNLSRINLIKEGRKLRYCDLFSPNGTNVNFVQIVTSNSFYIRTYERGVEDETNACGSGVTASAISLAKFANLNLPANAITKEGDKLTVSISTSISDISKLQMAFLTGPAVKVFEGTCEL